MTVKQGKDFPFMIGWYMMKERKKPKPVNLLQWYSDEDARWPTSIGVVP